MKSIGGVFVAGSADTEGVLIVEGRTSEWEYPVVTRNSGVGRAKPGRGIKESYLGFGYRNAAGANFRIDLIDVEIIESENRRKV